MKGEILGKRTHRRMRLYSERQEKGKLEIAFIKHLLCAGIYISNFTSVRTVSLCSKYYYPCS